MGVWKTMADALQKKLADQGSAKTRNFEDPERSKAILERNTYNSFADYRKPTPKSNNSLYDMEKEKGQ